MTTRFKAGIVAYVGLCFFIATFQIASDRQLRHAWAVWVPLAAGIDAVGLAVLLGIVACAIRAILDEWPWDI